MSAERTAGNGRTPNGQFGPGNQAAAGRTSRTAELRASLLGAISPEDVSKIAATLVTAAIGGDVQSAKLILSWIGKPDDDHAERDEGHNRILSLISAQSESEARLEHA